MNYEFYVSLATPKILRLGKPQINLGLRPTFLSLATLKILRLGNAQINLALRSTFRIFVRYYAHFSIEKRNGGSGRPQPNYIIMVRDGDGKSNGY